MENNHLLVCNYPTRKIGEDGCICEVVNKHELAALRNEIEHLRSDLKWIADYITDGSDDEAEYLIDIARAALHRSKSVNL